MNYSVNKHLTEISPIYLGKKEPVEQLQSELGSLKEEKSQLEAIISKDREELKTLRTQLGESEKNATRKAQLLENKLKGKDSTFAEL